MRCVTAGSTKVPTHLALLSEPLAPMTEHHMLSTHGMSDFAHPP